MPRLSSTGSCSATLRPSTTMVPPEGSMSRLIIFMVVVLPQPEGPTKTTVSPRPMSMERSLTAASPEPSKRLDTSSRAIITSVLIEPAPRDRSVLRQSYAAAGAADNGDAGGGGGASPGWGGVRLGLNVPVGKRHLGASYNVGGEVVQKGQEEVHEGGEYGAREPDQESPALHEPQRDVEALPHHEEAPQPLHAIDQTARVQRRVQDGHEEQPQDEEGAVVEQRQLEHAHGIDVTKRALDPAKRGTRAAPEAARAAPRTRESNGGGRLQAAARDDLGSLVSRPQSLASRLGVGRIRLVALHVFGNPLRFGKRSGRRRYVVASGGHVFPLAPPAIALPFPFGHGASRRLTLPTSGLKYARKVRNFLVAPLRPPRKPGPRR